MSETQDRMIKIIQEQPDDSTFEEILEELEFDRLIELCRGDLSSGTAAADENIRRRIAEWRKNPGICTIVGMDDTKEFLVKIILDQPNGGSVAKVLDAVNPEVSDFNRLVERGLADLSKGNGISSEEMRRRIELWRK